jgi:hypothetical protein
MTLANPDHVIQVSDRRLSFNGRLKDDESNKAGIILTEDARLVFGFTGLAKSGKFKTMEWITKNLVDLSSPDFQIRSILERLTEKASDDFSEFPELAKLHPKDRRLTVMFAGYLDNYSPPLTVYVMLTNFQDFDTGKNSAVAWPEFKSTYRNEKRPGNNQWTLIQHVGASPAVDRRDELALQTLLIQRKPGNAIVQKSVDVIRKLADKPKAQGAVGKQLSSVILPQAMDRPPVGEYHSMIKGKTIYFPATVVIKKQIQFAGLGGKLRAHQRDIVFPKSGRNQLCPCGSGEKYKMCHGKTGRKQSWELKHD